jgi:hypothetical protein
MSRKNGLAPWWYNFDPRDPRPWRERWSDYWGARRYMKGPGRPPTAEEIERAWAWVQEHDIKPTRPFRREPCGNYIAGGHTEYDNDCGACQEANSDAPEWTL